MRESALEEGFESIVHSLGGLWGPFRKHYAGSARKYCILRFPPRPEMSSDAEPLDAAIAYVDVADESRRAALSASLETLGAIVCPISVPTFAR
jgi:hypothetical protein